MAFGRHTIYRIALRIVLAQARQLAPVAVPQDRTRPIAQRTAPARFARALARPRMAHVGGAHFALACLIAAITEFVRLAQPLVAVHTRPAGRAQTRTGRVVARRIVATPTRLRAVHPKQMTRTRVQARFTHKPRHTLALAAHMIAMGTVIAFAHLLTALPKMARRTTIGAHIARHARWTITAPSRRIALATILAFALLLTRCAMRSRRTTVGAQRPSPAGRACALARHMMALAAVGAPTLFGAMQAIPIAVALSLAFVARVALGALTRTVILVAHAVVQAVAFVLAIASPETGRAIYAKKTEGTSTQLFDESNMNRVFRIQSRAY